MRSIINVNKDWLFVKNTTDTNMREGEIISLPHTWNATDGQDGGNDYFRGSCLYVKKLDKETLPKADRYYLEIKGANSSSDVYAGGEKLFHHDGGYSTFRVDITEHIDSEIEIIVDNSANETVYPQMADFTFYGGLYRDVNLICVPATHLDLEYYGGKGVMVTPIMDGANAKVEVVSYVKNLQAGDEVKVSLYERGSDEPFATESGEKVNFVIEFTVIFVGKLMTVFHIPS